MQKLKADTILFLTACVHPNGMVETVLQDEDVRLRQYLDAIKYYLYYTELPILVVENTNTDLSPFFKEDIAKGRLEILTFQGNDFDKSLGKGYGEGLILNYAFKHSTLIANAQNIIKVSGRHRVVNLMSVVRLSEIFLGGFNKDFVVCEVDSKKSFARSDMFIASKAFYERWFLAKSLEVNDSRRVWFEHKLYESISFAYKSGFHVLFPPLCVSQEGQSGTSGAEMKRPRLRRHIHFFVLMLLYKSGIAKIIRD